MKKLFTVSLLTLALVFPTFAQTNNTALEQATATAKASIATNLNEVVVDILRGVKTAGGEIYAASKMAITKSVDFTMEQAPKVVEEFLKWKFAEALIYCLGWAAVVLIALAVAQKIVWAFEGDEEAVVLAWVIRCIALLVLIINLGTNGKTMTKIKVAPRVYLIEYVVDAVRTPHR